MKKELPLSLKLIRGAIGKEFVIKHYKDGAVRTKYPDMSGIVASTRQRKCRNLFKEAVAYAKEVIADQERKTCWQKKLRKRNAVYNAAIKKYMLREKKAKEKMFVETNRLLRKAMMNSGQKRNVASDNLATATNNGCVSPLSILPPGHPALLEINKKYFPPHTTFDIKTAFSIFNST